MAYSRANLTVVQDNFGGKSKTWNYVSDDDCTASNYFDGAIGLLSVGDVILAGKKSATAGVDVLLVTSTTTHVTVTAATMVSG